MYKVGRPAIHPPMFPTIIPCEKCTHPQEVRPAHITAQFYLLDLGPEYFSLTGN